MSRSPPRSAALLLLALAACAGPSSPDDPTPTDVPARPTDTAPAGDSDPGSGDTTADTAPPPTGTPYRTPPYVVFLPRYGPLQACLVHGDAPPECFHVSSRYCLGKPDSYSSDCDRSEAVPEAPTSVVSMAHSSEYIATLGPDGIGKARFALRHFESDPWTTRDYPALEGGQVFVDLMQSTGGVLFGLTPEGSIEPIRRPSDLYADTDAFPATETYVHMTADAYNGACALTDGGTIRCKRRIGSLFQTVAPIAEPVRRIAIGGHGIGCAVTTTGDLHCDDKSRPDDAYTLLAPPPEIQGRVRDVTVEQDAVCVTVDVDRPVCWPTRDTEYVLAITADLVSSAPDLPLRDLDIGEWEEHVACGTHVVDESIHCWGDRSLLDAIPWGIKHYPDAP